MNRERIVRHIVGYIMGVSIFMILVPTIIVELSWLENRYLTIRFVESISLRVVVAVPLLISGVIFLVWSNIWLLKTGKGGPADGFNVAVSPRTVMLVTNGPYRHTRNPMVLGAFLAYFAISIYLNSLLCFILLLLFLFGVVFYLRRYEETRLCKDFGEEYFKYREQVPMIFPRIAKRVKK